MSQVLINQLIYCSIVAAKNAGKIIRASRKSGDLQLINKSNVDGEFDPQTFADRASQYIITSMIKERFPDVRIIAEEDLVDFKVNEDINKLKLEPLLESFLDIKLPEHLNSLIEKELVIWIDPLDSTNDYAKGNVDSVTVLIGIANNITGEPIGGVIHQPFEVDRDSYRTIWGIVGVGAFGLENSHDAKFYRICDKSTDEERVVVTSCSHFNSNLENYIDSIKPSELIKCGGAGYKILLVIKKYVHAYVYPRDGTKKWDTCAPDAIMKALGGRITDLAGRNINYSSNLNYNNSLGLIATLYDDHEYYISKVSSALIEKLK